MQQIEIIITIVFFKYFLHLSVTIASSGIHYQKIASRVLSRAVLPGDRTS